MGRHSSNTPDPRRGDFDYRPDFPDQPRCGAPSEWPGVYSGCCREEGHGGPHHYRLNPDMEESVMNQ